MRVTRMHSFMDWRRSRSKDQINQGKCAMRLRNDASAPGLYAITLLTFSMLIGCGSSKTTLVVPPPTEPVGLPTPAAAGPVNSYSGAQSPGAWTFTLDNTNSAFSYQPLTYPTSATSGALQSSGGFSTLASNGLAYEVLGRAAVLRPGDASTSPVFGVPQTQCYAITGRLRFQYITMFSGTEASGSPDASFGAPLLGYGSVVASTDSTGKAWQFDNLEGGAWKTPEGTSGNIVSGPDSFTGACSIANGEASIALSGTSELNSFWQQAQTPLTTGTQSNVWVGPSGFFSADQSDPTQSVPTGASVAGIAEPASPLSTSAMAAEKYLGVLYQAPNAVNYGNGASTTSAITSPVAFGQVVAGSGTTMTGGIFPNDNISGTPNSDTEISLGSQDATLNGLYPSVSITVPDPNQNCANFVFFSIAGVVKSGVDDQGYPTCTFPGVAVAGIPEGKYAVFINSYNWAARYGGAPMQIYLFEE